MDIEEMNFIMMIKKCFAKDNTPRITKEQFYAMLTPIEGERIYYESYGVIMKVISAEKYYDERTKETIYLEVWVNKCTIKNNKLTVVDENKIYKLNHLLHDNDLFMLAGYV